MCWYVFISHVGAILISPVQCAFTRSFFFKTVEVATQMDPIPGPNISQMPWRRCCNDKGVTYPTVFLKLLHSHFKGLSLLLSPFLC